MKLFGQISELSKVIWRSATGNSIQAQPDALTGSAGNVTIELPPKTTGTSELVDTDSTQTLSGKSISSSTNSIDGLTGPLVSTTGSQTLTNKTMDANSNTFSNFEHGSEVNNPSSGVHGVTGSIVGTSDTQTLSNKTLTNPLVTGSIQSAEIATPSTPPSNSWKEYFKTDGKYILDDAGIETKLESAVTPDLDDLGDVVITGPLDGQVLTYDSGTGNWVNENVSESLDDLSDVTITAPTANDSLQYNGSAWVNRPYNYAISSTEATQTTTSTLFADVTNAVASITTTGNPVKISLVGDGTSNSASILLSDNNDGDLATGQLAMIRDATGIGNHLMSIRTETGSATNDPALAVPPGSFQWIDFPSAGAHTYQLRFAVADASDAMTVTRIKVLVEELK